MTSSLSNKVHVDRLTSSVDLSLVRPDAVREVADVPGDPPMLNSIRSTSALFGNVRLRSGRNNLDASRTFQMHRECLRHAQWPVYHDVAWAGLLSKDAVHFAFVRVTSRSLVIDHCRDPIRVPAPRICAVLIGFALIEVSDSAISDPPSWLQRSG